MKYAPAQMARYAFPEVGREHIDALVERWKARCLCEDESLLFDDLAVWTEANLAEFRQRFLDEHKYGGAGTFLEKLAEQLDGASDEVRVLACELLVIYYLAVWKLAKGDAKVASIVAAAAPVEIQAAPHWDEVVKAMHQGVMNPGVYFSTSRPAQFAYVIDFATRFKHEPHDSQAALLESPWALRDFADSTDQPVREMRHILLHLLRPDEFERISSKVHRQRIVNAFKDRLTPEQLSQPVDEQVLAIRRALAAEDVQPDQPVLDFYLAPLRERWHPQHDQKDEKDDDQGDDEDTPVIDPTRVVIPVELAALEQAAVARGLMLPRELLSSLLAALASGKHVILTGAPGTAKTTLAHAVAEAATSAGVCEGFTPTTATADWTTYETIGGLRPTAAQTLEFRAGHFLEAVEQNRWLVIDELNRSNFDRAFGQLFTVLSGQAVILPYERTPAEGPLVLVPEGMDSPLDRAEVITVPAG
jgi:hypothetical protein